MWAFYGSIPAYRSTFFGHQNGRYFVEHLARLVSLTSFEAILDVGCGQGDIMEIVAKRLKPNQRISGMDASQANRDRVAQRFQERKCFGAVYSSLAEAPSNAFDLVICTEVIEHLDEEELPSFLHDVKRVLKPGFVVYTTPNNEDYLANVVQCPDCGCEFHRWQHRRVFDAETLRSVMEGAGFTTKACKEVAWAHPLRRAVSFIKPVPKNGLIYLGTS